MTEVVVINDLKHIELNNLTAVKQNCFLKLQHQFNTCHGDFEGTSILKTTGNVEKDNHRHRTIHQPSSLTGNSTRLNPKLRQPSSIDIEEDHSISGGTLFAVKNAYVTNNGIIFDHIRKVHYQHGRCEDPLESGKDLNGGG